MSSDVVQLIKNKREKIKTEKKEVRTIYSFLSLSNNMVNAATNEKGNSVFGFPLCIPAYIQFNISSITADRNGTSMTSEKEN